MSYPIFQTVSGKLSWSHYGELLGISDEDKRSFYEKECIAENKREREVSDGIDTSLFQASFIRSSKVTLKISQRAFNSISVT